MVRIEAVEHGSFAEKAGLLPGDVLQTVNGNAIRDVLDYRFYIAEKKLTLAVCRNGEEKTFVIKKPEYDDIGLEFETYLMDEK